MKLQLANALAIRGWMNERALTWLAMHASRSQKVVEVGCFAGRSTRCLGDHCPGTVYAVDSWDDTNPGLVLRHRTGGDGERLYAEFFANNADLIATGKIVVIRQPSLSVIVPFQADMVFIDADHSYEAVRDDIQHWVRMLRTNGILSGHDYGVHPGVKQAVDELPFKIHIEPHTSIWWMRYPHE